VVRRQACAAKRRANHRRNCDTAGFTSFGISLVVAASPVPEADVYGDLEARRGGNPYRVWVATEKFWQTPLLAEDAGKNRLAKKRPREIRIRINNSPQG
jgi:hypothetical protein